MKNVLILALVLLLPAAAPALGVKDFADIKERYSQELSAFENNLEKAVKEKKKGKKKMTGPDVLCEDENGKILSEQECLKCENKAYEVKILRETAQAVAMLAPVSYKTKHLGEIFWKDEVLRQTFMVNRSEAWAQAYLGWGPEDDFYYDYTNADYAGAGGTVKINLSGKGFDVIKAYSEYFVPVYGKNSKITKAFLTFVSVLYLHETMHGWQLKTGPVLDVKRYGEDKLQKDIAARKINKQIVDGTIKIVDYEEDAITFTNEYFANNVEMFEILVNEMDKLTADKNFLAKFPRIDRYFYNYYMKAVLADANNLNARRAAGQDIQGFGGLSLYTYAIQSVPLETLYKMIAINDKIAEGAAAAAFAGEVAEMIHRFNDLCTPEYNRDPVKDAEIIARIKKMNDMYKLTEIIRDAIAKELEMFDKSL